MSSFTEEIDDEEDDEIYVFCMMLLNTAQLLLQQAADLENEYEEDEEQVLERHFGEENETIEDEWNDWTVTSHTKDQARDENLIIRGPMNVLWVTT